jgi:hypothetical protein
MVTGYPERRCQIAVKLVAPYLKQNYRKRRGEKEAYVQHSKVHRTGRIFPSPNRLHRGVELSCDPGVGTFFGNFVGIVRQGEVCLALGRLFCHCCPLCTRYIPWCQALSPLFTEISI